MQYLMQK
jgi:hypothetical protein